ncbi:MAG: hypothetical protein GY867_04505 [bacterium]|nr:hypothetical protein [bacterium]
MSTKRVVMAGMVVFVYTFLYQVAMHNFVLGSMYAENEHLLRMQDQSGAIYALLMFLGFFLMSFGFSYIFAKGYEGKGCLEGIRFGLLIGVTFGVSNALVEYSVFPIPDSWIGAWVIGYLIQWILAGLIVAGIYKPKS